MTYLHDYVTARKTLREKVIPKVVASIMPILDQMGAEYEMLKEGQPTTTGAGVDSLMVRFPEGTLPDGYVMRIDFVSVKHVAWQMPDGTPAKGPGF